MQGAAPPFNVFIGQVIGAFQGSNSYDVITDYGRMSCAYHGVSRGPGGVQEAGGIQPGSFVWVIGSPGQKDAAIVGVLLVPWGVQADDPKQLAVSPQVSGFELGKRLTGALYAAKKGGIRNRPTDTLNDFVNGEWGLTSPHGSGVAVELFRAWISGGPMSGLWCFADSQLTRLAALDFEFVTLNRFDYIRRHGNSIVEARSRVFWPEEAIQDLPPRELEVAGPIHAGRQRFLAPRGLRGKGRPAFFHEHLDSDGSWTVTSASNLTLQRYCGVRVPEEAIAPLPADPTKLASQPLDDDAHREKILKGQIPFVQPTTAIAFAQHHLDLVEGLIGVRGRSGFDRLPVQWPYLPQPEDVPQDVFHTTYSDTMWQKLPKSFSIEIDPIEKSKTFYVGRSSFSLLGDGSVLVEDAYHSQILMSGGNIIFSAPHDIGFLAGRNLFGIAGKHLSLKADQHLDLVSNNGRLSAKAQDLLSLVGGVGGKGGVLIESKAADETAKVGTGADQSIGGVLVKSATGTHIQGEHVAVTAYSSNIVLRTAQLDVKADVVDFLSPNGVFIYFDDKATQQGYAFLPSEATFPGGAIFQATLIVLGDATVDGSLIATSSIAAGGSVTGTSVGPSKGNPVDRLMAPIRKQAKAALAQVKKNAGTLATALAKLLADKTPLNSEFWAKLGFSWATAKQLKTDAAGAFELPETRWQTLSRRGNGPAGKPWVENVIVSPAGDSLPTAAFPGYETWVQGTNFTLHSEDLYFDLATGQPIGAQPDTDSKLPVDAKVALDSHYLIQG